MWVLKIIKTGETQILIWRKRTPFGGEIRYNDLVLNLCKLNGAPPLLFRTYTFYQVCKYETEFCP